MKGEVPERLAAGVELTPLAAVEEVDDQADD